MLLSKHRLSKLEVELETGVLKCENKTSVSLPLAFNELETQTETGTELCALTHQ